MISKWSCRPPYILAIVAHLHLILCKEGCTLAARVNFQVHRRKWLKTGNIPLPHIIIGTIRNNRPDQTKELNFSLRMLPMTFFDHAKIIRAHSGQPQRHRRTEYAKADLRLWSTLCQRDATPIMARQMRLKRQVCVASSDLSATAVASQFLPFLDDWGFVAYPYTQRWSLTATVHTSLDCREAVNC